MANQIFVEVDLETKAAIAEIERFSRSGVDSIKKIEKSVDDLKAAQGKDLFKGFVGAGVVVEGLTRAFDFAVDGIHKFVDAALEGVNAAAQEESSIAGLTRALRANGQATNENIELAKEYADELERTTKFSSEAVLQSQNLIASLSGLSGEGLNKATLAAANLSSVLGTDLQSASLTISKAVEGNNTALRKLGITFNKGATDAETFNNVIGAIEQKLSGRAQAAAFSFAGAQTILGNAQEAVTKEFGRFVVKSPEVIALLKVLAEQSFELAKRIKEFGPAFAEFSATTLRSLILGFLEAKATVVAFAGAVIEPLKIVGSALLTLVPSIQASNSEFDILKFTVIAIGVAINIVAALIADLIAIIRLVGSVALSPFFALATAIEGVATGMQALIAGDFTKAIDTFKAFGGAVVDSLIDPFKQFGVEVTKVQSEYDAANDKLINNLVESKTEVKKTTAQFDGFVSTIKDLKKENAGVKPPKLISDKDIEDIKKFREEFGKIGLTAVQQVNFEQSQRIDKLNEFAKRKLVSEKEIAKAREGIEIEADKKRIAALKQQVQNVTQNPIAFVFSPEVKRLGFSKEEAAAFGVALTSEVLKGAQGAQKVVSQFVGQAAAALTGLPIAEPVAQMIEILAQGPEKVRALVNEFVAAIPVIIQNIILSLPVLVEALVVGIVGAINTIIDNLPALVDQFLQALIDVVTSEKFIQSLVTAAIKFGIALQIQAPVIMASFSSALIKESPRIAIAIAQATFEALKEQLKNLNPFNGGGTVGKAVGGIGKIFGFADGGTVSLPAGDKLIAGFNPDETIVKSDTTDKLDEFLNRELSGQNQRNQAQPVAGPQSTTIILQVGEQQLASVLLNLNRNGFRTTA